MQNATQEWTGYFTEEKLKIKLDTLFREKVIFLGARGLIRQGELRFLLWEGSIFSELFISPNSFLLDPLKPIDTKRKVRFR